MTKRLVIAVLSFALVLVGCGVSPEAASAAMVDPAEYLALADESSSFSQAEALIDATGDRLARELAVATVASIGAVTLVVPSASANYHVIATWREGELRDVSIYDSVNKALASVSDGSVIVQRREGGVPVGGASLGTNSVEAIFTLAPTLEPASDCAACEDLQEAYEEARDDWYTAKLEEAGAAALVAAACSSGNVLACAGAATVYAAAARQSEDAREDMDDAAEALDDCEFANCYEGGTGGGDGGGGGSSGGN